MRILGIDPGSVRTGWGVIEPYGPRGKCLGAGVIAAGDKAELPLRLKRIHEGLCRVIEELKPQAVAVEQVFYAKYANAAIKLGHARGVALLTAANAELEVFTYPPTLVKRTVAGKGNASKEQVGQLVKAILSLKELPPVDASDALAVALTHMQASRMKGLAASPVRSGRSGPPRRR